MTYQIIRNLRQPGKYHDNQGHGLYLRIDSDGGPKFWIQRTTIDGARVELGLGSWPVVSLADARDTAIDNKKTIRRGEDPRRRQKTVTFEEAARAFLPIKEQELKSEKHIAQWTATLETYAFPVIGRVPVDKLTTEQIHKALAPIWVEKTDTATRLRGRIESVLNWSAAMGYRSRDQINPATWKGNLADLLAKPSKLRQVVNQPAIQQEDAQSWWADLQSREGISAVALRFLTLTAARSEQARGALWSEVDLEKAIWTIPRERMKVKEGGDKDHVVPLCDAAYEILRNLHRSRQSDLIFPAPNKEDCELSDATLNSVMKKMNLARIERRARELGVAADTKDAANLGYIDRRSKKRAVPHGLRSTFRDWAAEHGQDANMAEIALAHAVGTEVTRAYLRSEMIQQRRVMMNEWQRFLERGGTPTRVTL